METKDTAKIDSQKLSQVIKELDVMGYNYIEGFVSNKKDKVRAIHRRCGKERYAKFCLYDKQECRYCKRETTESKYQKSMSLNDKKKVLELHSQGKNYVQISEVVGFTPNAVGSFIRSNGLEKNSSKTEISPVKCQVCGTEFVPKYKDKDKACSKECVSELIRRSKIKYTEYDLKKVQEYKERKFTNNEIAALTNVNINKIKEVVSNNGLQLTSEEAQQNAYKSKLEKNPNCMKDMLEARMSVSLDEYNERLDKIIAQLEKKKNKYSIPYLAKKYEMNPQSIRGSLHSKGLSHLVVAKSSAAELEVLEWVQSQGFEAFSTRQIIKPKEIDIYIPSLKLGIEYCGLYWHSEAGGKDRNYHRDKMVSCEESGIRLITIYEDEWRDRNQQVKNFLKSVMGVHSRRIYARKCEVKEVESSIAHRFLEDNHIQGKAPLKIAFGLFFEDELLGVVTGNVHHRNFGEGSDFVLNRLVFRDEVQVVGGASKLIMRLRGCAKEKGFNRLISWSDSRYSQGNVYEKCGFELESLVPPDYSYVTPQLERQSKQSNKKASLLKKGAVGDISMTETQLASSLGLSRLWDCGKKKYVINL